MSIRALVVLACLSLASVCAAKDKAITIEPDAAYVLVEINPLDDAMMKGVQAPGSLTLARYDPVNRDVRGGYLSPDTKVSENEQKRVLLYEKPIAKAKLSRLYLIKLQPDTWVIEGSSGTAFSLGSFSFSIKPGQIVDLGVVKPVVEWLDGEGPKSIMSGMMGAALFGSFKPKEVRPVRLDFRPRRANDIALPVELRSKSLTIPEFTADATFGNYLGGLVNRIGGRASRPSGDIVGLSAPVVKE